MLDYQPSLDLLFHALADPTRRAMVERLTRGPASVSELAAPMRMSLAAVVQHVQVLEQSRLVRTEKNGRVRTCAIEPEVLAGAEAWFAARRAAWERHFDRLGDYLAETVEPSEKQALQKQSTPKQSSRKRKRKP